MSGSSITLCHSDSHFRRKAKWQECSHSFHGPSCSCNVQRRFAVGTLQALLLHQTNLSPPSTGLVRVIHSNTCLSETPAGTVDNKGWIHANRFDLLHWQAMQAD